MGVRGSEIRCVGANLRIALIARRNQIQKKGEGESIEVYKVGSQQQHEGACCRSFPAILPQKNCM